MGICNLISLIKKYSPESIKEASWQGILDKGEVKSVAFDMPILVYAYSSSSLKSIVENSTDDQIMSYALDPEWRSLQQEVTRRITNHILNLFLNVKCMGGQVVAVFDGKSVPLEKKLVTDVRGLTRDKMRQELHGATEECSSDSLMGDFQKLRKAMSSAMFFRKADIYKHLSRVLRCVNIPCVVAHGEGEKCAAYLNQMGKVDAVYSVDMDTVAFGAKILISPTSTGSLRIIHISEFLERANMSVEDVISIALVSGCDYTSGIKGIGPMKAYRGVVVDRTLTIPDEYERFRRLFQHDSLTERHLQLPFLDGKSILEVFTSDMMPDPILIKLFN